ncbi:MAG: response regulator [archaeon]|nr:response regulator [archaeon]
MVDYKKRVLIVDDEVAIANIFSKMFSKLNCSCVCAVNGQKGLEAFTQEPFDAVFTDLKMPVMDGARLTQEIRKRDSKIPIFIVTGYNPRLDESVGYTEIIYKPVLLDTFRNKLQECVRSV